MRTAIFYIVSAIGILAMINLPSALADCIALSPDAGPTLLRSGECVSTDVTVLTPSVAAMTAAKLDADDQHIKDLEAALQKKPESGIPPYIWFAGCLVTSAASIIAAHYLVKGH